MPSDKQKELMKMQSIFDEYLLELNKKREKERNKKVLTFESLAAKRLKEFSSHMEPMDEGINLESKKIFDNIKHA
jgi:hypothetical protein